VAICLKPVRPVTDDDLLALAERNPGYQFERSAAGELIVTPTGSEGARRGQELAVQLGTWAKRDGRGVSFGAAAGFRLPDGAVRAPDASWVIRKRWDALSRAERRGCAPLCPDVVFEIRSEHQTAADVREKIRGYVAGGAHLAVFIDPAYRTVEIYRPGREPEIHTDPRDVRLDPELPGFALDPGPIFHV
jgi:Uma2 family endonuclease